MIVLNGTTESLQAVLALAVATTQPTAVTSYADTPGTGAGDNAIALNGTTPVTIAANPAANVQRVVRFASLYNGDTAAVTVTINKVVSAVNFPLVKVRLQPGFTLTYTGDAGWQVVDTNGAVQTTPSPVAAFPTDYLSGLKLIWNSATSISVGTGEAYVPSLGRLSQANAAITLSGLSLTASTFYHVYLFENAGVPSIECVTTSPSAPYQGTARTKTGDTSRRYLVTVLTDASGNIYNFSHLPEAGLFLYQTPIISAPFMVLSGNATVATTVSCSSCVPVTGSRAPAVIINNDTTHPAYLGNSNIIPTSSNWIELIGSSAGGTTLATDILLDSAQSFQYLMASGATANLVIRLKGYYFER